MLILHQISNKLEDEINSYICNKTLIIYLFYRLQHT